MFRKSKRIEELEDRCAKLEKTINELDRSYWWYKRANSKLFKSIFKKINELDQFVSRRALVYLEHKNKIEIVESKDIF